MKLGQGRIGVGARQSTPRGYSYGGSPSPSPSPTSVPGTYGGSPGSFITRSTCPPGYNSVSLSRGDIRCVPVPSTPIQPVAPQITVAPVLQQEFAPQFSPVVQQQQDSPYAAQTGAPEQVATTSQTATPISTPRIITAPKPAPLFPVDPLYIPQATPEQIPRSITAPVPSTESKPKIVGIDIKGMLPIVLGGIGLLLVIGKKK